MIKVLDYTKNPLTLMGNVASSCWNSKGSPRIAIECIESGHGRVLEYADVTIEISDYSSRVMREIYTHIQGTSRLQSSTRYINYGAFDYYIPDSIKNNEEALFHYKTMMFEIGEVYKLLEDLKIPKQDIANILPLGMKSKMVLKINARALLHMAELRLCNRALKEYRDFMKELIGELKKLDSEWETLVGYAKPKCEVHGYCDEKFSCGKMPKKESN